MKTVNQILSTIIGTLLAPFGAEKSWSAWIDVILWSVAGGIVALIVYKYVSNQRGIARVKNEIKVHLLEIRLFKDDIVAVLASTAKIVAKNVLYVGHNLLPVAVMIGPMLAIMIQLVALYAWTPAEVGETKLLSVRLDRDSPAVASGDLRATDVRLQLPDSVRLDAPPVRTGSGEIVWRLVAERPGDHVLTIRAGDEVIEKGFAVGADAAARVPVKRVKGWEALLYPAEHPLPAASVLAAAGLVYADRDLGWMPGGELGILLVFFALSLLAGIALKGVFDVTL